MKRIVLAHPSPDMYGSDRMLRESVRALAAEAQVIVVLPNEGPLCEQIRTEGGQVVLLAVPVLRKAYFSPIGIIRLIFALLRTLPAMLAFLRAHRPDVLYVNTVTLPWWLLAGRLSRVPRTVCHVHEAEERQPAPVRRALATPTRLAHLVIANSKACAERILADGAPRRRTAVIHNGVGGPERHSPLGDQPRGRLVVVGRLSPRKGTDVAVKAVSLLRQEGRDVHLTLVGEVFAGYEWYERELRELAGPEVDFAGFRHPIWPELEKADVVLMPSLGESFGLAAVEGMLAGRPVVASEIQGLAEIIDHGETGVLVPPGDPEALAAAVGKLLDDWPAAQVLAGKGQDAAAARFGPERYHRQLIEAIFPS